MAAKHPPGGRLAIGGVQTWCATVGAELQRQGHDVAFWGPEFPVPDAMFDVGIFANWKHTKSAAKRCGQTLIISHGVIPDEKGGDAFTSEEVRDYWRGKGPVIRQPIDLSFWTPSTVEKRYLTRFSYRDGLGFLPVLATQFGMEYRHLKAQTQQECREVLWQSAIVVATGRAAVEAMACGASVIIADDRGYQKPLLDNDTTGAMQRNYSGRGGITANEVNVRQAIVDAIQHRPNYINHVYQHHDAQRITKEIMCLLC